MVNVNKLRGRMVEKQFTQKDVAAAIGISSRTMVRKLQRGNFSLVEIDLLIKLLEIEKPEEYFFV